MKPNLPSQKIQDALKEICDHFEQEDNQVRERQIREYRRNKFYWDGLTNIFWSQTNHDWRVIDNYTDVDIQEVSYYDKRINIYQAYLESIIAALSASIPGLKAYPDDAENPNDITTAKACDKIYKLLERANNGELLWLHILFILATEGMVAAKICKETDKKYGVTEVPVYEEYEEMAFSCPTCGARLPDDILTPPAPVPPMDMGMDAGMEGTIDPTMMDPNMMDPAMMEPQEILCPECMGPLDPGMEKMLMSLNRITGYNQEPKSQITIEAMGGLFVKVPIYARNQEEMLYLRYAYETHYANVRKEYPHLKDKIVDGYSSTGFTEPYEKWGRLSTQYLGDYPTNTVTCKHTWLRANAFYLLKDNNTIDELVEMYPEGCCVTLVEDCFAEVTDAKLDDEWVITKQPLGDYITFQPIGTKMIDIQDITNELTSLTLQTIEHGINQTFADPNVLNFNEYSQTSVAPGMVYPATPKGGKSLAEGFHDLKTATLSAEVMPFGQSIQSLGQLSVGALPSLFGGADLSGSKTASQYSMSRNQAMQRLQTTWKMMTVLWKDIFSLAIPAYIECVTEDQKFVKKDANGSFINVFIRKSELEGTIGSIELDGAENLPETFQQKKDTIMQFLQAANPVVMEALIDPINLPLMAEVVGLGDITLPGMEDRNKQYEEIGELINSAPITMPAPDPMVLEAEALAAGQDPMAIDPAMMQPPQVSSVTPEMEVDNHEVHIRVCKSWLVGDAGRLAKIENPDGYLNVLLHMKEHMMNLQMMMPPPEEEGSEETEEGGKPQNDKMAAPLKNGNVNG